MSKNSMKNENSQCKENTIMLYITWNETAAAMKKYFLYEEGTEKDTGFLRGQREGCPISEMEERGLTNKRSGTEQSVRRGCSKNVIWMKDMNENTADRKNPAEAIIPRRNPNSSEHMSGETW